MTGRRFHKKITGWVGLTVLTAMFLTAAPAWAVPPILCEKDGTQTCQCQDDCTNQGGTVVGTCSAGQATMDCPAPTTTAAPATNAASTAQPFKTYSLINPFGTGATIQTVVGRAIKIFTGLAGSLALLMFVYGGFLLLTSGGNEKRIEEGKNIFIWSAAGLVVIFGSYIFLRLLFSGLGL